MLDWIREQPRAMARAASVREINLLSTAPLLQFLTGHISSEEDAASLLHRVKQYGSLPRQQQLAQLPAIYLEGPLRRVCE